MKQLQITIKTFIQAFLISIIALKIFFMIRYTYKPTLTQTRKVETKPGLGDVYNKENKTFKILNEDNVRFTIAPTLGCSQTNELLIMVSSGPRFIEQRKAWRHRAKKYSQDKIFRLVFLVATPPDKNTLKNVIDEAGAYNDVVLTSVKDGHRKLGYKILSGYVWSYLHCSSVKYVAKTDDNVVLDLDKLVTAVRIKQYQHDKWVACTTPNRNSKVIRGGHFHMRGNWSISEDQCPWDINPDWCTGFLYITTPDVGAKLVQAGYALYNSTEVEQIEDSLITGVLRNALVDVEVETYETGLMSHLWLHYLSHCAFLTGFKITFFNSYVISKVSSRSNTWYVGSVTDLPVLRYFFCLHFEGWLEFLEHYINLPQQLYDVCIR